MNLLTTIYAPQLRGTIPSASMQVVDLELFHEFKSRTVQERTPHEKRKIRSRKVRLGGLSTRRMLQELADTVCSLCRADSAGVTIETKSQQGMPVLHWAAVTGNYAKYRDANLPRCQTPCQISLDTMRPQHMRVSNEHFASLGLAWDAITDGVCIPWSIRGLRGTLWIAAHTRDSAFDIVDYEIIQSLADLTKVALRDHLQQEPVVTIARIAAHTADGSSHSRTVRWPQQRSAKNYLIRLNAPPSMRLIAAASCEVHGDQLVLLDGRRELIALFVLGAVAEFCEFDMRA